jgi:flavin-dependent dehydrogenase
MFDTDVFVIGGGPAGLAAAIAAARNGLRVTVADGCVPFIDKACGEGLLPDSLAAAAALGITLPAHEARAFRGIRFVRGDVHAEAAFRGASSLKPSALGIRRTILHRVLMEHAERAGVAFLWGAPVSGIDGHVVRVANTQVSANGVPAKWNSAKGISAKWVSAKWISAKWIVGADGARSRVRMWAGLDAYTRNHVRFGFRRHYGIAPWSEFVEVYWTPGAQVYVTPVAHDEVGVASLSRDPHRRLDDALALLPDLRERLSGARERSSERGAVTATRRLRAVYRGHIALIGDASGSVDAITGQGLGLSFREALALGQALSQGDLAQYQTAHARILRRPTGMAELLLAMGRWPAAAARAIRAFHDCPPLFEGLLDVHIGKAPPLEELATHVRLGWHILRG